MEQVRSSSDSSCCKLQVHQPLVQAALDRHQRGVRALLGDAAVISTTISSASRLVDSRWAMAHDRQAAARAYCTTPSVLLSMCEVASSRNRIFCWPASAGSDELLLARRQPCTAFAERRVVAAFQPADEAVGMRCHGGSLDLGIAEAAAHLDVRAGRQQKGSCGTSPTGAPRRRQQANVAAWQPNAGGQPILHSIVSCCLLSDRSLASRRRTGQTEAQYVWFPTFRRAYAKANHPTAT